MIISRLKTFVLADIEAGNSVVLRSASGRGKSDFCEHLYDDLASQGEAGSWGFQSLFLATQTPPDLIGYQFKGEGEADGIKFSRSEASIPLWMQDARTGKPAWCFKRFFLVLDEYGQGEADVKRASAELLLKGKIGPWSLPPYSVRVACTNKGARYGVTKDFDFVINRRSEYDITDDLESWLDWADKPYKHEGKEWLVTPLFKAFAKQNPSVLFEEEPKQQGPWCTPRSFCGTDRFLQMVERMTGKAVDPNDTAVAEGVSAKIGVPSGGMLMGWLQFRLELPQYEEVIAAPAETPVPVKPDLQMIMAYEMAARTHKKDLGAVVHYMQRLPKDMAVTYVTSLIRRDKTMMLEPAVAAWTAKNSTLLALVQALS